MALKHLSWFHPFNEVLHGHFEQGDIAWFLNGKLNVSYNCLDRHLQKHANKIAILWEGDEPTESRTLTYRQLHMEGNNLNFGAFGLPFYESAFYSC